MWSDKIQADTSENAYDGSTESEEMLLKEPSDTRLLLVGSKRSSRHNHLSSNSLTNQSTPSAYDPTTTADNALATNDSSGNDALITLEAAIESPEHQTSNALVDGFMVNKSDEFMTGDGKINNTIGINDANMLHDGNTHFRQPNKRRDRRNLREKILASIVFLLFLLLILFISLYGRKAASSPKTTDNMCLTAACVGTSHKILIGMNISADPCEDFYSYACGGWIEKNHIPAGANSWTVFSELAQTAEYFGKELLESETLPDDSRGLQLAKTYYTSCVNEQAINSLGLDPIHSIISRLFGGWRLLPVGSAGARPAESPFDPEKFDLTELVGTFLRFGHSVDIIQLLIEKDPRNSSRFAITLAPGEVSMLPEYYLETTDPKIKQVVKYFRDFMRKYAEMLGVPAADMGAMDAVFELESSIAQNMEPRARQSIETNFFKLNITELQELCPVINWKRLFTNLFQAVNYEITDAETAIIGDRPYLQKRCEVYKNYLSNPETIKILHDAAIWRTLWSTGPYMPAKVRREIEVYEQASTGVTEQPQRWLSCVRNAEEYFGMTIARKFVAQHFDVQSKKMATKMIMKIKDSFKNSFYQVDWMDAQAKKGAEEKVDMMGDSIGYPNDINDIEKENRPFTGVDNLSNDTFLENSFALAQSKALVLLRKLFDESVKTWDMAPHIVNAFYNPRENHIYFPAGILQKPFYDAFYPLALNYGGIGVVVGHEIVHAFDRQGSKYDAKGNLRQWWSESTRDDFEKNSECMVRQYQNYTVQGKNVDGHLTLSENIADNGGLKASYRAFLKLHAQEPTPAQLPGLNLTSNQLFFISFAQVWCKRQLPQAALHTVMFDVHAPERYRVIGTLSNSDDFAKAFSCPSGSYMNPKEKCVLW